MYKRVFYLMAIVVFAVAAYRLVDIAGTVSADDSKTAPKKTAKILTEAEQQEKVWNSADMLRARAWLEDYFKLSAKYTPKEAQEYRDHLKNMTAKQMELWLMKFDHDRQMSKVRQQAFEKSRSTSLARDVAAIKQHNQALKDVNAGENKAAATVQKQVNLQQKEAFEMYRQRQSEASEFWQNQMSGPYYGGYGGDYHFHMY